MRALLTISMLIAATVRVLATSQTPDYLFVDGGVYPLYSNPLEDRYEKGHRPNFQAYLDGDSTANWRGYIAYWQLRDDRLHLIGIDSYLGGKKVFLPQLFPGAVIDGRVPADWFSGELRIPDGKELQYVHMGYGSTYERDIIYTIRAGKVVERRVIDNTKKPLPNERDRAEEELQKLDESEKKRKKP